MYIGLINNTKASQNMTMVGWYFYLVAKHVMHSLACDVVTNQTAGANATLPEEIDLVQFSKIKNELILEAIEVMQHAHAQRH